jgi:folylpolyglutamate synthase/dihydropteroate synthase
MLEALLPRVARLIVTRATNQRSADPEVLAHDARQIAPEMPVEIAVPVREALAAAWSTSSLIVVAGSIFLLGDVMREIGA